MITDLFSFKVIICVNDGMILFNAKILGNNPNEICLFLILYKRWNCLYKTLSAKEQSFFPEARFPPPSKHRLPMVLHFHHRHYLRRQIEYWQSFVSCSMLRRMALTSLQRAASSDHSSKAKQAPSSLDKDLNRGRGEDSRLSRREAPELKWKER